MSTDSRYKSCVTVVWEFWREIPSSLAVFKEILSYYLPQWNLHRMRSSSEQERLRWFETAFPHFETKKMVKG